MKLPVIVRRNHSSSSRWTSCCKEWVKQIWLHNGKHGSALYSQGKSVSLHAPDIEVVDCTGAGDGSLSGFILGKYLGKEDADCMKLAHTLSAEILQVNRAIVTHLTRGSCWVW